MNITNSVGYSTRSAEQWPQSLNSITYVTEGTLVNIVDNVVFSHVVLDEVQERSVDIDLLLMKIKKKLHEKFPLKLIVMTATVDAHPIEAIFTSLARKRFNLNRRMFILSWITTSTI